VVGSCENDNELSGSIKGRIFPTCRVDVTFSRTLLCGVSQLDDFKVAFLSDELAHVSLIQVHLVNSHAYSYLFYTFLRRSWRTYRCMLTKL
jgi:hypothetical protein